MADQDVKPSGTPPIPAPKPQQLVPDPRLENIQRRTRDPEGTRIAIKQG
jgi:hypothetical protein